MTLLRPLLAWLVLAPVWGFAADPVPPDAADRGVEADHFDHVLLAKEIFRASNEVRNREGVAALKPDARLAAAADDQAAWLSLRVHSGHDSPVLDQADPRARVQRAGLADGTVAENAATLNVRNKAAGRNSTYRELAAVIVQAWLDSPGHRANLLSPTLRFLGCGTRVAYLLKGELMVYAIQDFYTPAPRLPEPAPPTIHPEGASIAH